MSIVLHIFIKNGKFDCSLAVGTKICFLLTYILSELSARFQLENQSVPARNLPSSSSLEPENSSSNSSLVFSITNSIIQLNIPIYKKRQLFDSFWYYQTISHFASCFCPILLYFKTLSKMCLD